MDNCEADDSQEYNQAQDFETQLNNFKEVLAGEMETQTFNAINSFISGIAHEVRSPLQAIDTAIELLIDNASGELHVPETEVRKAHSVIQNSANLIDGIVTNCMTFGNFKTKKSGSIHKTVMLDMKQVNLNTLITETVDVFTKTMEFKDNPIQMEVHCPKNIKCVVPNHVARKVLLNLFSNGLKAIATYKNKEYTTKRGKIIIRVLKFGKELCIEVEDNGRGIPKDFCAKLFNPFYRAYRDMPGMGLGLYLCKVWASNANMEVYLKKSVPGKTIFRIDFRHIETGGTKR